MLKFFGNRGVAAVMGLFLMSLGAGPVQAQGAAELKVPAISYTLESKPTKDALESAPAMASQVAAVSTAIQTVSGSLLPNANLGQEAAWLHGAGWPLWALVDRYATNARLDEQMNCLATAVYFEARGESLDGQMAVAKVVMNRTASPKYPDSWCETVKQPWQFSFVRNGRFPPVDSNSWTWAKAQAVALLAASNALPNLKDDVLWYHADYVAPAWGPRLVRVSKIGAHIFYRA